MSSSVRLSFYGQPQIKKVFDEMEKRKDTGEVEGSWEKEAIKEMKLKASKFKVE